MKAQVFTTSTSALGRVGRELVPRVAGDAQHHLAVDEVLRAAEGEKTDLHSLSIISQNSDDQEVH